MSDGREDKDHAQFKGIVRDHYPQIYRFLVQMARDAGLAEELTQETFASAWQKFNTFENRSAVGTWLCRIAYNKFVDDSRRRKSRRKLTTKLKDLAQERQATDDPTETLLRDERGRRLYRAVQELDEQDRVLVVMHYMQDMSFSKMAEILDLPIGTIKWRISQVLNRLRKMMEE